MNIAIVSGSVREGRQTHQVALLAKDILENNGVEVTLVDVLEFKNGSLSAEQVKNNFEKASGLLLIAPEYNGTYPGEMKSLLDSSNVYEGKPSMAIGVSAGALGGILVVKALQQFLVKMYSFLYPQFVITPHVQNLFTDGKVSSEDYKTRMEKQLNGFVSFIKNFN